MGENLTAVPKLDWLEGRRRLIEWFKTQHRPLPWREAPHPYATWLCEIIMQQTRIDQGTAYWHRFMDEWPTVEALANASEESVLKAWQGLGYYSRARNLHRAAQLIAHDWGGRFPTNAKAWQAVPGVGPYTSAAIASICFGDPVPAIDGNVLRVLSRYLDVREPIDRPAGRSPIEEFATEWLDEANPGQHNEALMELGALICTPRTPACSACPLAASCRNAQREDGSTPEVPLKAGKTKVLHEDWTFHVLTDGTSVWMRERPSPGIWGGLWEFPSTIGACNFDSEHVPEILQAAGIREGVQSRGAWGESFEHILSHRKLKCTVRLWEPRGAVVPLEGRWLSWDEASKLAIPRAIDRIWQALEKSQSSNALS